MANRISIIIEAKNRASAPIQRVQKDVRQMRGGIKAVSSNLKEFNRSLFATTAVIGTLMIGFRRAFQTAKIGAQFSYIREQFEKTFGAAYLETLRKASRGMVDAMTMMQQAMAGKLGGLDKGEIKNIFTLGAAIGKMQQKPPAQVITELTTAFRTGRPAILANYFATLKFSNAFTNANKAVQEVTKGWSAAGIKADLLRKYGIERLARSMEQYLDANEGALEIMYRTGASLSSLRQIVGEFIARSMAPLVRTIGTYAVGAFDKLFKLIGSGSRDTRDMRDGLIDLSRALGAALMGVTGLWGSVQILNFALTIFGITLSSFLGTLMALSLGINHLKRDTETWAQFLSRLGTIFSAAWEAFKTWNKGTITLSGDLYRRLQAMDEVWLNRAMLLIKVGGNLREGLKGIGEGFSFVYDMMLKVLRPFGIFLDFTKQMSGGWSTAYKWIGRVIGALGALYGAKLALGAIGKLPFLGNLLQKIPVVGGLFGGKGLGGKRGHSPINPLFVKDVGRTIQRALFGPRSTVGAAKGSQGILFGPSRMAGMMKTAAMTVLPLVPIIIKTLLAAGALGALVLAGWRIWKAMQDPGFSGIVPDDHRDAGPTSALGKLRETKFEGGGAAKQAFIDQLGAKELGQLEKGRGLVILTQYLKDGIVTQQEANSLLDLIAKQQLEGPQSASAYANRTGFSRRIQ